ncbi:T9SS type A sorting domain-containing protein [Sungkyunkwania multivorans]|uniref:T9SS type A sorting domain-containing protein n=1 Tax=Sungkyunkwania multivorans TaxID=1173618 RepID=A0ABW3CVV5_9FLAO
MLKNYLFIFFIFICASISAQINDKESSKIAQTDKNISVHPNPAKQVFQVVGIEHSATLRMYSVLGKMVNEIENYHGQEINVQDMRSGIYLVNIQFSNQKSITRKLIVE